MLKMLFMVITLGLGLVFLIDYLAAQRAVRAPRPIPEPDPPSQRPPPACYACSVDGTMDAEAVVMLEGRGITVDGLTVDIRQALCGRCYQRERRQWQQEPPTRAVHWTDQGYLPTYAAWTRW